MFRKQFIVEIALQNNGGGFKSHYDRHIVKALSKASAARKAIKFYTKHYTLFKTLNNTNKVVVTDVRRFY